MPNGSATAAIKKATENPSNTINICMKNNMTTWFHRFVYVNGIIMLSTIFAVAIGTISSDRSMLHAVAVSYDQFAGTIVFGNPDVTISAQSGKARADGKAWGKFMCSWLDAIQDDHCIEAIKADRERAQVTIDYLNGY